MAWREVDLAKGGAKARQKAFQVPVLRQPLRKNASHFNDFVNLAGDGDESRPRAYRAFHEYFVSNARRQGVVLGLRRFTAVTPQEPLTPS